jgi:hypothetical protein
LLRRLQVMTADMALNSRFEKLQEDEVLNGLRMKTKRLSS